MKSIRKRSNSNGGQTSLFLPQMKSVKQAFRDLRNYLAGQFVGATRDEILLDEILKCLFCKLYIETGRVEVFPDSEDDFELAKQYRSLFARVKTDFPDIYAAETEILLDPRSLARVAEECCFSLIEASSDPIGDAFEVFVGSESRGRSGQFFTPLPAMELLVAAIAPSPGETIIDPACGAGGFLATVARHFLAQGVSARQLGDLASQTFYGVDKDDYLTRLARLHVSLLTGGHPLVRCDDSIALHGSESDMPAQYDIVLTNPPFGVRIVAADTTTLMRYDLGRKWKSDASGTQWLSTNELQTNVAPQVLFVERCVGLLKPGGRLGMVLPESILSNKSYRHVVQYLRSHCKIQCIVGMPESLFKTSGKGGTHTKTCLLVATKAQQTHPTTVFMAEAKWCGHDSRALKIANNDLPEITKNISSFLKGDTFEESTLGFMVPSEEMEANILCPRYFDPQIHVELGKLKQSHSMVTFGECVKEGILQVMTGDEIGKLAYGTGEIPFIRTSDISNWELKADPKHVVDWEIFESLRKKQDVKAGDILMVKDGTYLIGTCAIISEYDTQIIYQSHLYKIRVNLQNRFGLDPYLLIAILSSAIVQRQIRAKQFTQDIIDSLGERIGELILPIPRSAQKREQISSLVQKVVKERIEARELAREAREAVMAPD